MSLYKGLSQITPSKTIRITNPKENEGWWMYESNNQNQDGTYAVMKVIFEEYTDFTLYINSYAEDGCDYTCVSQLDSDNYSSSFVDTTESFQNDPETFDSSHWKTITFNNISDGEHYFYVIYRKDGGVSSHLDRGFLLINPNQ